MEWVTTLHWNTQSGPSLELLVRYLQKPGTRAWKRAVFTRPPWSLRARQHDDRGPRARVCRCHRRSAATHAPGHLRALPDATARAGRGGWCNTAPAHTQVFVAVPLAAVDPPDPDGMMVALHLDDAGPRPIGRTTGANGTASCGFTTCCNSCPNGWWTTSSGVEHDLYPELPVAEPASEAPRSGCMGRSHVLADSRLHPAMEALGRRGASRRRTSASS